MAVPPLLPPGLVHTSSVRQALFQQLYLYPAQNYNQTKKYQFKFPRKEEKKEEIKPRKDRILSWSKPIQLSLWAPHCSGAPSRSSDDKF